MGDATIVDAILDRLMQHHHRITLTGDSLRSKKAQATQGGKAINVEMTLPTLQRESNDK
ncbi:ATP-binding protein [Paraburkholderia humisilvae]|uniref:ATP-binding protein n=1 Tax=Paraburkholderia humisilvae TaxID=627669 RepID=UPI00248368E2|nr:ATP-binding protein [Paraburkholderia humisilvae]